MKSSKESRNKEPTIYKEQVTYNTINMLVDRTRVSITRVSRIEGESRNEDTSDKYDENDDDEIRYQESTTNRSKT
jgi:hypothetical protein